MSSSIFTVNTISGFKAPIPLARIVQPEKDNPNPLVGWLEVGSERILQQSVNLLVFGSSMFRQYQSVKGMLGSPRCFSLDGLKPHSSSSLLQAKSCSTCPVSNECEFIHRVIIMEETSGASGVWKLQGMAGQRWATFLAYLQTQASKKRLEMPLRVRVESTLVNTRMGTFIVPKFSLNNVTRLSDKERRTAQDRLTEQYDLRLLESLPREEEPEEVEGDF